MSLCLRAFSRGELGLVKRFLGTRGTDVRKLKAASPAAAIGLSLPGVLSAGTLTVNMLDDVRDGVCDSSYCSLGDVIWVAQSNDLINFDFSSDSGTAVEPTITLIDVLSVLWAPIYSPMPMPIYSPRKSTAHSARREDRAASQ